MQVNTLYFSQPEAPRNMNSTHKQTWLHRGIFVIKYTFKIIFIYVHVKVHMHVHVGIHQGQEKESDPLELELQGLVG